MYSPYVQLHPPPSPTYNTPEDVEDKTASFHNITSDGSTHQVQELMSKFGPVQSFTAFNKPVDQRIERYGYVTFVHRSSYLTALKSKMYVKGNRLQFRSLKRKVFITGFSHSVSVEQLHTFFSQYGCIIKIEVVVDWTTNLRQDVCFITYLYSASVNKCLAYPSKVVNGSFLVAAKHSVNWNGIDMMGKRIFAVLDVNTNEHWSICGADLDPIYYPSCPFKG